MLKFFISCKNCRKAILLILHVLYIDPVDPSVAMNKLGLDVTMNITNIRTQGYPGTGKTSLLDLVMGKDPVDLTRTSTGCVDPPSFYLVVKSEGSDGVKWDHVTTEKMFSMVCEAVKKKIDDHRSVKATVPETTLFRISPKDREQTNSPKKDYVRKPLTEAAKPKYSPSSPPPPSSFPSPPFSPFASPSHLGYSSEDWFRELLKEVPNSGRSGVIFDSHWMMVTDSGGQPPFLDAAALFLQNTCLHIFPVKLNEFLNEKPDFSYFNNGVPADIAKSKLRLTNQQIIETLAKTVSAFQPPSTPSTIASPQGAKFVIVGTFEDKAHLCSETIEMKEATLEKVLKPYKPFQVLYDGKIIFPINAIITDKGKRQDLAEKLRNLITDTSGTTMKIQLKLRWFGFLLTMLTRSEKQKRSILSLDECLEIGWSLGMDRFETTEAIQFFHDIGRIMHFNTPALRSSVIVDTKPLLDKVSLLLSVSFLDEKFLKNQRQLILVSGIKERLQQRGRFSQHTLKSFLKFEEPITVDFFLDVLEHVKAIAKIDSTSEYIMPCALSYLPDEQCVPDIPLPWIIRFRIRRDVEKVYIPLPMGYLPAIIVFLLTCYSSHFFLCSESVQHRNQFKLEYEGGGSVFVVDQNLQLEIFYTCCKDLPQNCQFIRDCVLNAMSLAEERLHITRCSGECELECECKDVITKVDSFLCPCMNGEDRHICTYNHRSEIAECVKSFKSLKLESGYLCWIQGKKYTHIKNCLVFMHTLFM